MSTTCLIAQHQIRLNASFVYLFQLSNDSFQPNPAKMSENYHEIEGRIILACQMLDASEKPNVAAAAREFEVPEIRLRSRWKERLTNLKTT